MDKQTFLFKFNFIVENSNNILITSHLSPDDDSISSVLSMQEIIKRKYPEKTVSIKYATNRIRKWEYFEDYRNIDFVKDTFEFIQDFDLIIVLDVNERKRFGYNIDQFKDYKGKIICIDHHSSEPEDFDLIYVDPKATSTAELVFRLFCDDESILDKKLCEYIMLGIIGDTGNFEFINPTQAETVFPIIQKLIQIGNINIQEFKSKYIFYSQKGFEIIKEFINNAQIKEIRGWPKFFCTYVSSEFAKNYKEEELSEAAGYVSYAYTRIIENVDWGVVMRPSKTNVKFSIRSLPGSISARNIGERTGLGGGHDRAGGGMFTAKEDEILDVEKCLEKLFAWMEENEPVMV